MLIVRFLATRRWCEGVQLTQKIIVLIIIKNVSKQDRRRIVDYKTDINGM